MDIKNENISLSKGDEYIKSLDGHWPSKNTAFLITHGIGNQKPIETLDTFSRGIITALQAYNPKGFSEITIEHIIVAKKGDETYYWFDNFIRIKNAAKPKFHIDIYEYYWANRTENKTDYNGIVNWLGNVTSGARKHYKGNKAMAKNAGDRSLFIDKNGNLNYVRYYVILRILGSAAIGLHLFMNFFRKAISYIPIIGNPIACFLDLFKNERLTDLSNVIGDIVVYNDPNPRSDNQTIRKEILNCCVKAIRYLLEPEAAATDEDPVYKYDKVIIAGHSLGSQISFDAINRLTHQINLNELDGYNAAGDRLFGDKMNVSTVLDTFITFGSPLDKTAFFFREESNESEYVKRDILENFHCFKQKKWDKVKAVKPITSDLVKVFENISWINYYDQYDYVSGSLDYYEGLTNVNCNFPFAIITHSNYWSCNEFFGDVLKQTILDKTNSTEKLYATTTTMK